MANPLIGRCRPVHPKTQFRCHSRTRRAGGHRCRCPGSFATPFSGCCSPCLGIWAFAFGLTIPFLTLTARDRGVSLDAIGVIAASFLLTQIVFQLPLGALSDRSVGRGPLAAGIALFSLATVGFTQADTATAFILLRAVQGVAFALGLPAYRALVADVTAPDQRGRAYATLGMAYSGGTAARTGDRWHPRQPRRPQRPLPGDRGDGSGACRRRARLPAWGGPAGSANRRQPTGCRCPPSSSAR